MLFFGSLGAIAAGMDASCYANGRRHATLRRGGRSGQRQKTKLLAMRQTRKMHNQQFGRCRRILIFFQPWSIGRSNPGHSHLMKLPGSR